MLQRRVRIAILIVCISHFLNTCMYLMDLVYGAGKHDDEDEIIQGVLYLGRRAWWGQRIRWL